MVGGKRYNAMMNIMEINGYRAIIQYDPDIEMFRGEFLGLNGGADFYAQDIERLRIEGELSLKVFLDMCEEDGVEPRKEYSGRFNLRVPADLHEELAVRAASTGKSLNQLISEMLTQSIQSS